jgi:hypothetical protein
MSTAFDRVFVEVDRRKEGSSEILVIVDNYDFLSYKLKLYFA